ncbi:MAP kinase kinase [Aureococcus anophagefferens]|nr:MAP kinase kinase [Aureococcus anophagefferens]
METSPRNGRALLGVLGQDLGLQMDLAAVDRDAADANEESYDFSEGGTLIDWRRGLEIKTMQNGQSDLGRGACASVRRALHAPTLTVVAVKLVAVHDDARRRQLLRELAALHQLSTVPLGEAAEEATGAMGGQDAEDFSAVRDSRSERALRAHIVAFHGAFTNPAAGCVCAVLEYMDARSVHDVMEARSWRPLEDDALAVVAHGCIAGLAALHADRQLHRDLKPPNVLLDWKWRVKLSDFGVSRAVDNTLGIAQTYVGTLAFMAPERIVGGDYSYGSDAWSIGLCFAARWEDPAAALDAADGHDAHLVDITNACLARDAADRPDAATLLDHPFVRRGSSIYAAASKSRGRGAGPDFGFPVWHTQGDEETEPSPQQRDPPRDGDASAWRRRLPHEPGRERARSADVGARADWAPAQLAALAAQLHVPAADVRAAFEAGDAEARRQLAAAPPAQHR